MFNAEDILDTLLGEYVDGAGVPGVENIYAPGGPCDRNYCAMLEAYERLCRRLNRRDDDPDVEIIINSLLENQRIIALKMFEYGVKKGGPKSSHTI